MKKMIMEVRAKVAEEKRKLQEAQLKLQTMSVDAKKQGSWVSA